MSIIGHESVRQALEKELPSVSLLIGPAHVGKSALAHHIINWHKIWPVDVYDHALTGARTREIRTFAHSAPFGPLRVVLTHVSSSRDPACTMLLKIMEEPPPTARFILLTEQPLPATVVSRARVFPCGYLRLADVQHILVGLGMSSRSAAAAAALTPGTVPSGEVIVGYEAARENVLSLIEAMAHHDHWLFLRVCQSCDGVTRTLLYRWLHEAATGDWRIFSEAESCGLAQRKEAIRTMILSLSNLREARAALAIRVALEPFVIEER